MGYRSDVAILLYGEKDECRVVADLLMTGIDDECLRETFDVNKQEHTYDDNQHHILWCFGDIKWYENCQNIQANLFRLVNEVENSRAVPEGKHHLAVEFVRIGEKMDDNEWDGTDSHNFNLLQIQRKIDFPQPFTWKE